MLKALFNSVILLLVGSPAMAIVGGVDTSAQVLPSYLSQEDLQQIQSHTVVVLNTEVPGTHSRCTGTLIAKNVVLTAAHCIGNDLSQLFVVPSIYEFSVMERKSVSKVIVHENYKSFDVPKVNQPNWDLALIRFDGELPNAYKATTWMSTFSPSIDRFWLFVAGYGKTDTNNDDMGELRFSRVTIKEARLTANQSYMRGDQSVGEGICKGDSGGPAYIKLQNRFYVLGVVSAIVGGCRDTSYFNQTVFYNEWIKQNLNLL